MLLQSPHALCSFEDNDLVIPLVVVEELDGLKKADGEKGANARADHPCDKGSGAALKSTDNRNQSGGLTGRFWTKRQTGLVMRQNI